MSKMRKTCKFAVPTAEFTCDAGGDRVRMHVTQNGALVLKRHYLANQYELDERPGGTKEKLYLGGDYYSAGAVLVRGNSGAWQVFYINSDYLGSITHIVNSVGSVVAEYSYDACVSRTEGREGRLRNPVTHAIYGDGQQPELFLGRGYTGHEHLNWFGLINMNARLYDPVHGRFLAPDPYVQAPDFTQSFNRYGYAWNNPFKYTDRSGEWFGIDDLFVAAAGFIAGYVSYGLSTGNWGWNAIGAGGLGAVSAWVGYNTAGLSSGNWSPGGGWNALTGKFIGNVAINNASSFLMPSINVPVGDNFGVSSSIGFGLGSNGLSVGANFGVFFRSGKWAVNAGIGHSSYSNSWGGGATLDGWGGGYYHTNYTGNIGPDGKNHAQTVGAVTFSMKGTSLTFENDFFAFQHQDKWRTSAFELQVGDFVFGSSIFTNDGADASGGKNEDKPSKIYGSNKRPGFLAWTVGKVYESPAYIGLKSGKNVYRFGYSAREFQDFQQNGVHQSRVLTFGNQNYYLDYSDFKSGFYNYSGYYNPYALFNR